MRNYMKFAAGGQVPAGMSKRQYASVFTMGRDPFFKEGGVPAYANGGEAEAKPLNYAPEVTSAGEGLPANPYTDRPNPYYTDDAVQGYDISDRDLAIYRGPYRNMAEALAGKARTKAFNSNQLGRNTELINANPYLIDELRKRNKWDNFSEDVVNVIDPARANPERYRAVTDSLANVYTNTLDDAAVDSTLHANLDPAVYEKALAQYKARQSRFAGQGPNATNYGARTAVGPMGSVNTMVSNRDMGTKRIASTMPGGRNITHAIVTTPLYGTDKYDPVQDLYKSTNTPFPQRSVSKAFYDLRPIKVQQK